MAERKILLAIASDTLKTESVYTCYLLILLKKKRSKSCSVSVIFYVELTVQEYLFILAHFM